MAAGTNSLRRPFFRRIGGRSPASQGSRKAGRAFRVLQLARINPSAVILRPSRSLRKVSPTISRLDPRATAAPPIGGYMHAFAAFGLRQRW